MAFPQDPIDLVVELAIGADIHADPGTWSWTDVSVREAPKVTSTRGRRNRIGNFPPTRVTATADNTDGSLCRHNPLSPHFGLLKKNTPMRVRIDNGSGYETRAAVYVPGFPPSWDPSEQDQTVVLSGVGITDRLGRSKPLRSAMFRTMSGVAAGDYVPHAYWPMEDGIDATKFASGLADGNPATFGGAVTLAVDNDGLAGSDPLPTLAAGATINYSVPTYTDQGQWMLQVVVNVPAEPGSDTTLMEVTTSGGTVARWRLYIAPGAPGTLWWIGLNSSGVSTGAGSGILLDGSGSNPTESEFYGHPFLLTVGSSQDGGDVTGWLAAANGVDPHGAGGSGVAGTHGAAVKITARAESGTDGVTFGHLALFVDPTFDIIFDAGDNASAMLGWAGEMAHERAERLCREERVPFTTSATTSQSMGPQSSSRLLDQLRECANADVGLLFEDLNFGLTFVSSSERYNLDPSLTLQYDDRDVLPPFEPTDDDQDYYNQVTASRPDGSSATEDDADEIDAVGQYADQVNPNVETDDQLNDIAGWRLNLGLNDELTWPNVRPNFYASSELRDDWMLVDIGDVVHITGHPSPLAPDAIRQIVEGYTEVFGSHVYDVTVNLSPASPWDVAELDDDNLGKLDTDGTELVTAVNSSATSLTVLTTGIDSPLWTTDGGEMPIPLIVSGEVMSVTAVASVATDAFGRTTANGWGSADSGQAWTTAGGVAADYAVAGGVGTISVSATGTDRWVTLDVGSVDADVSALLDTNTTPTGGATQYGVGARYTDSSNYYYGIASVATTGVVTLSIRKRVAGVATTLVSLATSMTIATNVFVRFRVFGSSLRLDGWLQTSTAQVWTVDWTDTDLTTGTRVGCFARRDAGNLTPTSFAYDTFAVANPQVMTVTRSVNGVSKAQAAGAAINVYRPARLAL